MTVHITDTATTIEDDGVLYAFGAAGCRDLFVEQRRTAHPR